MLKIALLTWGVVSSLYAGYLPKDPDYQGGNGCSLQWVCPTYPSHPYYPYQSERDLFDPDEEGCSIRSVMGCKKQPIGTACTDGDRPGVCWPTPLTAGGFCICGH